jgi:hypothetical protein
MSRDARALPLSIASCWGYEKAHSIYSVVGRSSIDTTEVGSRQSLRLLGIEKKCMRRLPQLTRVAASSLQALSLTSPNHTLFCPLSLVSNVFLAMIFIKNGVFIPANWHLTSERGTDSIMVFPKCNIVISEAASWSNSSCLM